MIDMIVNDFLVDVGGWYESQRKANGKVNSNVMSVGMILLYHMGNNHPLQEEQYLTKSQVRGIGGTRIEKILVEHGETRKFTSEGGRTSRGTVDLARQLARLLNEAPAVHGYEQLDTSQQAEVRFRLQDWFVERVRRDYFDQQFIETADYDPAKPARAVISSFMEAARNRGGNTGGALAQHLVGAKLSLRFPGESIVNEGYTTADKQTGRPGDFKVNDTAFHVTMSPSEALFKKRCRSNISNGFRPIVLVPTNRVVAAWQMADDAGLAERIAILSIEDFVGTNVDEMAVFSALDTRAKLRQLLERYNERVRAVESDPSLQVVIPENL